MIEILLAKMNQITNRLVRISSAQQNDMYGDGAQGNVFYGTPESSPSTLYETTFTDKTEYKFPLNTSSHFKNLYIDVGTTVKPWGDYGTILVQDKLNLAGTLSVSNTHTGAASKSDIVPDVEYQLRMLGETTQLYNTNFLLTGGSGTNNKIFGNSSSCSGGCIVIYYTSLSNEFGVDLGENWGNSIKLLGGGVSTVDSSGGCLLIAAKHVVLHSTGSISAEGGNAISTANKGISLIYKIGDTSI